MKHDLGFQECVTSDADEQRASLLRMERIELKLELHANQLTKFTG